MVNARKEGHGAVEVAKPDLCGARVEIESALFAGLGCGIRRRKDFDANRRRGGKRGRCIGDEPDFLSVGEQDDIGDSNLAVAGKDRLLNCGELAGVKAVQEIGNSASSLTMAEARGWRHDELAVGFDLESLWPIGESGIAADFLPAFGGGCVG
jgi:hypothetical protein